MTAQANYKTFSNAQLGNSLSAIWTADATYGNAVKGILAINADSSDHTVTLTLVRKGGTASDAYAVVLADAYTVPANQVTNLLANQRLLSALDELQCGPGDYLYGEASAASEVTLLVYGS
jgi:hypothetical protein